MFQIQKITLIFLLLGLFSCKKDEVIPQPVADFSVTVNGQAPNATLTIVNKSTDATTYEWSFGTGASIKSSTDKEPANITVDKAGQLSITLKASNGTKKKKKTIQVNVA
ncbi:MAG: PKD domain-containing protein, partial [Bacteroidetes bacterium]